MILKLLLSIYKRVYVCIKMQDVCKNIDEYDVDKGRKILIVFDDIIADMINNKKLN